MADPRLISPADGLDPMIACFVARMTEAFAAHPPLATLSPPEARTVAEAVRRPWREGGPPMARVEEIHAPAGDRPVRVRLYYPERGGDDAPTQGGLVYLHGGGWTMFSLDTHDRVMREYAARSGLVVAGVDYALSPEVRFPYALHQVADVLRWLGRDGQGLGVDPARLFVGGDSAGANLAVAASLALRDAGLGTLVRGLLLNYGVFRADCSEAAARRFGGPGYMLTAGEMATFWANYLGDPRDAANPLASPLLADLRGLPPTFLTIPECDILTEQSLAMAQRLDAGGVAVTAALYPGATHSFLEAVSIAPLSGQAFDDASQWLRDRAAAGPSAPPPGGV